MTTQHVLYSAMEFVEKSGYVVSDLRGISSFGALVNEYTSGGFGILKPRSPKKRTFLGLIPLPKRALPFAHLGNLYMDEIKGTSFESRWVLEVFGDKNLVPLQEFGQRLGRINPGVTVEVILGSQEERFEPVISADE